MVSFNVTLQNGETEKDADAARLIVTQENNRRAEENLEGVTALPMGTISELKASYEICLEAIVLAKCTERVIEIVTRVEDNQLVIEINDSGTGIAKTTKIGNTVWRFQLEFQYFVKQPDSFGADWSLTFDFRPVIQNPLLKWFQ